MVTKTERELANVCVYVLLKRGDQVLLILRKNTNYYDDHYGLVAGHVEKGESAKEGMVREAYEEVGITIHPDDLNAVHVMHRVSNRVNVDIYFVCTRWQGEPFNNEPHKCGGIGFFPMNKLPANTVPYMIEAFKAIAQGVLYSELGWIQKENGKRGEG